MKKNWDFQRSQGMVPVHWDSTAWEGLEIRWVCLCHCAAIPLVMWMVCEGKEFERDTVLVDVIRWCTLLRVMVIGICSRITPRSQPCHYNEQVIIRVNPVNTSQGAQGKCSAEKQVEEGKKHVFTQSKAANRTQGISHLHSKINWIYRNVSKWATPVGVSHMILQCVPTFWDKYTKTRSKYYPTYYYCLLPPPPPPLQKNTTVNYFTCFYTLAYKDSFHISMMEKCLAAVLPGHLPCSFSFHSTGRLEVGRERGIMAAK